MGSGEVELDEIVPCYAKYEAYLRGGTESDKPLSLVTNVEGRQVDSTVAWSSQEQAGGFTWTNHGAFITLPLREPKPPVRSMSAEFSALQATKALQRSYGIGPKEESPKNISRSTYEEGCAGIQPNLLPSGVRIKNPLTGKFSIPVDNFQGIVDLVISQVATHVLVVRKILSL